MRERLFVALDLLAGLTLILGGILFLYWAAPLHWLEIAPFGPNGIPGSMAEFHTGFVVAFPLALGGAAAILPAMLYRRRHGGFGLGTRALAMLGGLAAMTSGVLAAKFHPIGFVLIAGGLSTMLVLMLLGRAREG